MYCSVFGCPNSKQKSPEKYFFYSPRDPERRENWLKATGKFSASTTTKFLFCEDHFDMDTDVEFFRMTGAPSLWKSAYPHRNLTSPEIALQSKLDKIDWKCFVPCCENRRLLSDRKVVFFAVPEGLQGQLWRAAVFEDKHKTNGSSVSDLEFCCEDHFDISNDLNKRFSTGASVEYTIKAGTVPSIKLSESKLELSNEVNVQRLADKNLHHRVILNNRLAYLYGSKYPQLMDRLQTTDMLSFVAVNGEGKTTEIKTEPMDGELEYEICTKPEVSTIDLNPLELEAKSKYESDTESESSNDRRKEDYDPDVTTDDLPSDDGDDSYEWSEHDGSDDSLESENEEDDVIPEDEKNHERFECRYCGQLVRNLDTHVERSHWRFAKNLNRTHCGLCWKVYPKQSDLRKHQGYVHNGNAYSCDICDTLTRTYETMRIHILRAHSNERTLLCQHCGKSYKFIWELRRHVQTIHFDVQRERTHACEHCDKKFFSAAILRRHVKEVHLKLRPYNCDVDGCNKAFKQPFHLKVHHTQVHAKLNLFSCVICDKKFSLKCNLVAHMKNVHQN